MGVPRRLEEYGGRMNNFKFQLGEIVVPAQNPEQDDLPNEPSKVVAIQLRGYIRVQPIGTSQRLLVHSNDYERFEGKLFDVDY